MWSTLTDENRDRRLPFAAAVRHRRRTLHLTQKAVAARVGWSRQTVVRVEAGKFSPALDRLWALAAALELPLSELVADAETRMEQP